MYKYIHIIHEVLYYVYYYVNIPCDKKYFYVREFGIGIHCIMQDMLVFVDVRNVHHWCTKKDPPKKPNIFEKYIYLSSRDVSHEDV